MVNAQTPDIKPLSVYGQTLLVSEAVYNFFHKAKECLLFLSEATGHTTAPDIARAAMNFMRESPGTGIAFNINGEEKVFQEKEIKPALALALNGKVIFQWDENHTHVNNFHVDWKVLDQV